MDGIHPVAVRLPDLRKAGIVNVDKINFEIIS